MSLIGNLEREQEEEAEQKESHQLKALIIKNLKIQNRQPCTNICQIITPIICLIFTMLIRDVAISKIPSDNDSIFKDFPLIPQKFNDYTLEDMFPEIIERDCAQWYNIEVKNKSDMAFIGSNNGLKNLTGLLGKIPRTAKHLCEYNFSMNDSGPMTYLHPPMFKIEDRSVDKTILDVIKFYNTLPYDEVKHTETIHKIPDGAVTFHHASKDGLKADLKINDLRVLEYHRNDGVTKIRYYVEKIDDFKSYYMIGEGFLAFQHAITSAFIQQSTTKKLDGGIIYMPFQNTPSIFVDILVSTTTTILFPLSLSLLLPVFLYLVVLEKEEKLIQMMRMNGMKMKNYWLINFLFNLMISLITNLVFCFFGYFIMDIPFFNNTGIVPLVVVLFGWILVQISMATLFQVFIHNSRAANIIGYLISIWTNLIAATLNIAVFQYPREMPLPFLLYPTFSFNRLFYLMFNACSEDHCVSRLSDFSSEARTCILVLYSSFFIFQLLGMYLHEVIPQQFGTSQPLLFPITSIMSKINGRNQSREKQLFDQEIIYSDESKELQKNDEEVKNERLRIAEIADPSEHALIIKGLRKVYENGKIAVRGMDLVVEDKEVFGLLGPNGAGKTTLISMITGVFSPSEGNCYVGGFSILEDIQQVHLRIGVCPQFDLLWPQLSVEEHLYFYARLRGTKVSLEKKTVEDTLKDVNLVEFRNFKASQLSGGMKRRLSVGISMVGNPRIVFLDEPTTGLDPENRRHLWEVLNECKKKRALFLTTHLMEEADTLCNRIGIITDGTLRTIGIQQRLKRIYGKGYHLSINVEIERNLHQQYMPRKSQQEIQLCQSVLSEQILNKKGEGFGINTVIEEKNSNKIARIKEVIHKLFPEAVLDREINGFLRFKMGQIVISECMKMLSECEEPQLSNNWSLSNSTLEDVFLQVLNKFDKNHEEEDDEGEEQIMRQKQRKTSKIEPEQLKL